MLFRRDKDYVVKNGEVIIVDEFTGRLMPGRRYSEGLHQAIEAKERVKVQRESVTLATITFQNYFRLYQKLAGMTGTAATEAEEFAKIYKLEVVAIPTNREMIREDYPDQIYSTEEAKFKAVCNEVEEFHAEGRPVLIGTTSIETSERLSDMLMRRGINARGAECQAPREGGLHHRPGRKAGSSSRWPPTWPGAVSTSSWAASHRTTTAYEDVNEHILKETLHFINQGVSLLREQGAFKDWPADLQENLNQTKDTIAPATACIDKTAGRLRGSVYGTG